MSAPPKKKNPLLAMSAGCIAGGMYITKQNSYVVFIIENKIPFYCSVVQSDKILCIFFIDGIYYSIISNV